MARKREPELDLAWTDDELQLLLEALLDCKSKCEFQGKSWESKRSKYEINHLKLTQKVARTRNLRRKNKGILINANQQSKISKNKLGIHLTNYPQTFDQ